MDTTVKGFLRIISAERVKERLLVRRKARLQPAPWQKSNDPSAGAAAHQSLIRAVAFVVRCSDAATSAYVADVKIGLPHAVWAAIPL